MIAKSIIFVNFLDRVSKTKYGFCYEKSRINRRKSDVNFGIIKLGEFSNCKQTAAGNIKRIKICS